MISVDEARQRVANELLALAKRDAAAMRILSQASEMDFSPIGFQPMSLKLLDDFTSYAVTTRYDIDQEDVVDRAQAEAAVALMLAWAMTIINPK